MPEWESLGKPVRGFSGHLSPTGGLVPEADNVSRAMEKNLASWVRQAAERLGFNLCGIAPAFVPSQDREQYLWWLDHGFHGEMRYMERQQRQDIRQLLPGVRSVICA